MLIDTADPGLLFLWDQAKLQPLEKKIQTEFGRMDVSQLMMT